MKNIFILVSMFACAPALLAAPFALLDGVVPRSGEGSPFALMQKISRGEPVCIRLENQTDKKDNAFYLEKVQQGYQRWFSETWKQIVSAKRTEEFEDLREVLNAPVSIAVEGEGCSTPDLELYVVSKQTMWENCLRALACVRMDAKPMRLFFIHRGGLGNLLTGGNWNVLMHELGHTLGLADQYKYGRNNASARYHTPDSGTGLMYKGRPGMRFSCDDADGMINLLDVAVFKHARGGADGWRSLCKKRAYKYVNGRPSSNDKYVVEEQGEEGVVLLEFDVRGDLVQERFFPERSDKYSMDILEDAPVTVQEKNPDGRVIYEKRANGEEMFCSYTYEKKQCIFLQNGELVALLGVLRQRNKGRFVEFSLGESDGQESDFVYEGQGKHGTLSYWHGKQTTYFSVDKNGVQPNVPSEPPALLATTPFAIMGEENTGKNLSKSLRARTQRAIEAAKQSREFRQAERFFKRFVQEN